jgi:methionyl-tRNA formyltransferase
VTATNRRVGVLSTLNAPLLPLLLQTLYAQGVDQLAIILDAKVLGPKDQEIWRQRTGGAFDDTGLDLYDFGMPGISVHFTRNHNSPECAALLRSLDLALLLNGGTPRKLETDILQTARLGVLNVHPGLLPKYRGSSCVEWAILNDDPVGNSAHFMVEAYDEGPVVATEPCTVTPGDDYVAVRVKVYRAWAPLMARTARSLLNENRGVSDFPHQGQGELHRPISPEKLQQVRDKLSNRQYRPRTAPP